MPPLVARRANTLTVPPAGVKVDGQTFNDNQHSLDWDGVWDGAVSTDASGWNAEFAIPLTLLRFTAADVNSFGFQVLRNVSRKHERSEWSYEPRTVQGYVSTFGQIDGLAPRFTAHHFPGSLQLPTASAPAGVLRLPRGWSATHVCAPLGRWQFTLERYARTTKFSSRGPG